MNVVGVSRATESVSPSSGKNFPNVRNRVQELHFYNEPPNFEMNLEEFEEFALARLKILRRIEELKSRNIIGDTFNKALEKSINENLNSVNSSEGNITNPKTQRELRNKKDIASHFILRAAYCKTEELRRWFMSHECFLFKFRLDKFMKEGDVRAFLHQNNLHFDRVGEKEKESLQKYLLSIPAGGGSASSYSMVSSAEFSQTIYYKIPFVQALDLVASRQCYVSAGKAYVPSSKLLSIITAKFRMSLSKSMTLASLAFSQVTSDTSRISSLLNNMNSQYTGGKNFISDLTADGQTNELNSQNVDSYASSMPLCMSRVHAGLKADHKLKHWGRLQYGLFLKGAGLTLEESLMFFQKEFTKIMTGDEFTKNYSYNIRHMYGQEGKRASYTPYNCKKIILGNPPSSGENHGCPYRHYDDEHLSALLNKLNIGTLNDRKDILDKKRAQHYQLACLKHFEVTHPDAAVKKSISVDGVGEHPNAW
eukprot:CAMPEP_0184863828 /NCGR_PEP_ID=MMETSP0580-20130426/12682_1 /TAXON_ID=1118495 /ORGANISM="Dactyliosolen fragilissimus" /LENGTH=479 /DNA_ID=CAMNT_0027362389 /DNA_START=19 /DNA_END=1455 /DNA_ORIENTATION=-